MKNKYCDLGMSTYFFKGKIVPEHDASALIVSIDLELKDQPYFLDFEFTAKIKINHSIFSVEIKDVTGTPDICSLRNYAQSIASYAIDAAGYLNGKAYNAYIISAVEPNGREVEFGAGIDELISAHSERPLSFEDLWNVILNSGHMRRALADLRESVKSDTGFFCYRAVESIRQHFVMTVDKGDIESWQRMRDALLIDRSCLDSIKRFAKERRHGGIQGMSGEDRVYIMQYAWNIVDRFSIYLHNGSNPLNVSDYHILK